MNWRRVALGALCCSAAVLIQGPRSAVAAVPSWPTGAAAVSPSVLSFDGATPTLTATVTLTDFPTGDTIEVALCHQTTTAINVECTASLTLPATAGVNQVAVIVSSPLEDAPTPRCGWTGRLESGGTSVPFDCPPCPSTRSAVSDLGLPTPVEWSCLLRIRNVSGGGPDTMLPLIIRDGRQQFTVVPDGQPTPTIEVPFSGFSPGDTLYVSTCSGNPYRSSLSVANDETWCNTDHLVTAPISSGSGTVTYQVDPGPLPDPRAGFFATSGSPTYCRPPGERPVLNGLATTSCTIRVGTTPVVVGGPNGPGRVYFDVLPIREPRQPFPRGVVSSPVWTVDPGQTTVPIHLDVQGFTPGATVHVSTCWKWGVPAPGTIFGLPMFAASAPSSVCGATEAVSGPLADGSGTVDVSLPVTSVVLRDVGFSIPQDSISPGCFAPRRSGAGPFVQTDSCFLRVSERPPGTDRVEAGFSIPISVSWTVDGESPPPPPAPTAALTTNSVDLDESDVVVVRYFAYDTSAPMELTLCVQPPSGAPQCDPSTTVAAPGGTGEVGVSLTSATSVNGWRCAATNDTVPDGVTAISSCLVRVAQPSAPSPPAERLLAFGVFRGSPIVDEGLPLLLAITGIGGAVVGVGSRRLKVRRRR